MEEKIIRSNCGICSGGCGMLVHVSDGKITKVEGDPDFPHSSGALCPQGLAATQFVYHPDRLKYPIKRSGERGGGQWQRISWDEALDTIATRLGEIRAKYGPLGVAVGCGTGRCEVFAAARRFLNAWGAPNRIGYPHNCLTPRLAVGKVTYGKFVVPNIENSDCIVLWGCNVTHTSLSRTGRTFTNAFKKGAKTICIDPYFTPLASKANLWLQLRPGTDCALALAWLNVIISENLYNDEFVQRWTYGFDRLVQHVQQFTPEWAEPITWVPAEKIRQAARMYASTKPASILFNVPVEFGVNTFNTIHGILSLPAVTGNVDNPGGNVFRNDPGSFEAMCGIDMKPENWDQFAGDFPLLGYGHPTASHAGWKAVLTGDPYPIRGVLFHACNALIGHENPRQFVYKAIMSLDFISVMDHFMTPTAELADIVLPATTCFERDGVHTMSSTTYSRYTSPAAPKSIEPLWECRNDADVLSDILKRMNLDFGASNNRDMLDKGLLQSGLDFEELTKRSYEPMTELWQKYEKGLLRTDGKPGFETPSGKIELYSDYIEELGHDPLPVHVEPPESPYRTPELFKEYPLVLTTGIRSPVFFHSQYRQIPWLREIHPEPIVRINSETAKNLHINNGDWVYIESPRGRCKQRAMLTLGIDPRVVLAEHDWWFPEKPAPEHGAWESNINLLVDNEPPYDPLLGSTPARSLLCKIYKTEGGL